MYKVIIPIKLKVRGPFISQSTVPGSYALDAVQALDSAGRPIIPGTEIVGRLRQAWEELLSACRDGLPDSICSREEIEEFLGRSSSSETGGGKGAFRPVRKRLFFSDFVLARPSPDRKVRYRIKIDPERGAVEGQALAAIEPAVASGREESFLGRVTFLSWSRKEAEAIEKKVLTGLRWTESLGAFGSIGFGRLLQVESCPMETHEIKPEEDLTCLDDTLELCITPLSPFCIARRHMAENNLFESLEHIPGNAIIGTLAETLDALEAAGENGAFAALKENLSKVRALHAFPAKDCFERPVTPPLSVIKAGGDILDAALLEGPCLINGQAPEFSVDWKDSSDVRDLFGWPGLRRELRVRTAIDAESRRSAKGQLFSYEMIVPGGASWLTRVYFDQVEGDRREEVKRQFVGLIRAGLLGLGKTKTIADVRVLLPGSITMPRRLEGACPAPSASSVVIITLQTPALLLSPAVGETRLDEYAGHKELMEAYRQVWDELSGRTLRLRRFFTRQFLSGGPYQYHRFMKKAGDGYYPWIMTEAGSVFVFDSRDGWKDKVKEWESSGLPLPANVISFYGINGDWRDQWKSCPFIPQNGFGEIACNLGFHWMARPAEGYEAVTGEEFWHE